MEFIKINNGSYNLIVYKNLFGFYCTDEMNYNAPVMDRRRVVQIHADSLTAAADIVKNQLNNK